MSNTTQDQEDSLIPESTTDLDENSENLNEQNDQTDEQDSDDDLQMEEPEKTSLENSKERFDQNISDIKQVFGKKDNKDINQKNDDSNKEKSENEKKDSSGSNNIEPPPVIAPPVINHANPSNSSTEKKDSSGSNIEPPPVIAPPVINQSNNSENSTNQDSKKVNSNEKNQAEKSSDIVKQGKDKISKLKQLGDKASDIKKGIGAVQDLPESAKEYAKEYAKDAAKKAIKKAAQQAAKAAARLAVSATQAVVGFLVSNPLGLTILAIILLIFIIMGIIIAIFAFSRESGRGPMVAPTTSEQVVATGELQALTGNQLANNELLTRTINATKTRLERIKPIIDRAYSNDPATANLAKAELDLIIPKLDNILAVSAIEERRKLINEVKQHLRNFNTKFPRLIGFGAVNGSYLPVPGVRQGDKYDCGVASVIMVVRYYNPDFNSDVYWDPITNTTKADRGCVIPEFINDNNSVAKDFVRGFRRDTDFNDVRKSLAAGDPVIIYTKPGGIYNNQHIFVIIGYDPKDKLFFVNNPFMSSRGVPSVEVATKRPNGVAMTEEHLLRHLGDPEPYGHAFMIRERHK